MLNTLITSALTASLLFTPATGSENLVGQALVAGPAESAGELVANPRILALETLDLANRYPVESVSKGFKENILIALGYLAFQDDVLEDGFALTLNPGEVFAFHNKGILPEFKEDKIVTQESDFTTNTGYKVVAGLGGNGVCHLASLMNKVASEAGLEVIAPTNHNFAEIPGIDRKYGTSISTRNGPERQNLYIRNVYDFPVRLRFVQNGQLLALMVLRAI